MTDKRIFTVPEVTTAIVKAIDFLDKNPTRHITGTLAVNSKGEDCFPNDSDAQCFCMLGAISKELDVADYPTDDGAQAAFTALDISEGKVFGLNDADKVAGTAHCADDRIRLSGTRVLDFLRSKLEKAGVEVRPS